MRRWVGGIALVLIATLAAGEVSAQQQQQLMDKLKGLAGSNAGLQLKATAQAAYANAEREWAACKALPDVNARAACYERVHDKISAVVGAYLQ
ncbi:hypothetical protein [Telmatospirillum sp.]|uniref:hypothetical protein n=1 Tax=Telmatospirillum sp. TaxID=2079197 RepID=UPI00283D1A95|nr:hypothetical protein [Telmatospirillum sp.]MDR3435487.1 hypothetical protein [Telmatospirillum sp.]